MNYEKNVEVNVGQLAINGVDVGNVHMMGHQPNKQSHEIPNPQTGGILDTKEFYLWDSMKVRCDKHTHDQIAKVLGLTPVAENTGRAIVKAEEIIVSGSHLNGDKTLLAQGRASEVPISFEVIELVFDSGGYTPAVEGDIGKTVTGGTSGDTGTLVAYNNTTRTWLVSRDTHADVYQDAEVATVSGGTGQGTIATAGRTPGGIWPDSGQAGSEFDEDVDFQVGYPFAYVARKASGSMTDPDTVYAWYSYQTVEAMIIKFPKGDTAISTRAEYIYTKNLANGKTQEIKIPDGYIVAAPEIVHEMGEQCRYEFEIRSVEKASAVGAELGQDKRIT